VPKTLIRVSFRLFAAITGIGLLGYLVLRTGPAIVWHQLHAVRWGLALVITLGGVSQLIKTCAWRQAFSCDISGLSWSRSVVAQLVSDAAGQIGVAGKLLGEGVRISLVGSAVPLSSVISASAIDGGLHALTAAVITVSGIAATLLMAPVPHSWRLYALLFAALLTAVVLLAAISIESQWHLIGNTARALGRVPRLQNWVGAKQSIIDSAEDNFLTFRNQAPAAFWSTLSLNLLWHLLAVLEVFLILRFMGIGIAMGGAFVFEGLTKVINLIGAFNPGNFGTYEAGNMLITKVFGVAGTTGLTLALCRRVRAVFWAGIGVLCLTLMKRPSPDQNGKAAGSSVTESLMPLTF
jgi:hypothetical protein